MKKLLKITNFNYQNIFHNFSLELQEGNITMISGNNKCGKTTLIKAIGQIIPTIDTIEYTFGDPFIKQENIGISLSLADDYGNQTVLNVLQNDEDEKVTIAKCHKAASFCLITDILENKVNELNAWDKLRVWLAKELLLKPKLLLLDDPCLFLTHDESRAFLQLLLKVHQKLKCTIVMTTSSLCDTTIADYLYILNKGKIVLEGDPVAVYKEEHILNRLGLKIPFMVDLSLKLQFYNLIDEIDLDIESMVDDLWPLD